jgi:hypothetical protein
MENKTNCIVRVHRPELTPQEYERRMAQIKKAAADLLVAAWKEKANV